MQFLLSERVGEKRVNLVWVTIACHTSQMIAENIGELAQLVRLGVLIDFKVRGCVGWVHASRVQKAEREFPRGEVERVFVGTVLEQGWRWPAKAPPASWPGHVVRCAKEWRAEKMRRAEEKCVEGEREAGESARGKSAEEGTEEISEYEELNEAFYNECVQAMDQSEDRMNRGGGR